MVRPVTGAPRGAWKAALAIAVVAGGLIWHLLACIESPMAFSPGGKDLAFVTMEPYGDGGAPGRAGQHTYRLMVLTGGKPIRVLEETSREMLSGPAYSSAQRLITSASGSVRISRIRGGSSAWR